MNEVDSRLAKVEKAVGDFGCLVHDFRIENTLTLNDMASLVSISSSYLWRIENGKRNPDLDIRVRILTLGMNWSMVDILLYLEQMIAKESADDKSC
ncbi:helix-turn-helix domain-containing protein [Bacillus cytotoxicus]|uniref:helix-turn-helix domain-containing protein n=1 Tax=Bacillus cytotoxicus TaxID=580165 RepID=UPI003D7D69E8